MPCLVERMWECLRSDLYSPTLPEQSTEMMVENTWTTSTVIVFIGELMAPVVLKCVDGPVWKHFR